jgi:uncharacterized protein (DUF58 family)
MEMYLPPMKGKKHILRIIREIINTDSVDKKTSIKNGIEFLNKVQKKRSVLFLMSDFIDDNYIDAIKLVKKRHDIIPVKIKDEFEVEFPDLGNVMLKDIETGKIKLVDTSDIKIRSYLTSLFVNIENELQAKLNKSGVRHLSLTVEEDYVKPFIKFFKNR